MAVARAFGAVMFTLFLRLPVPGSVQDIVVGGLLGSSVRRIVVDQASVSNCPLRAEGFW